MAGKINDKVSEPEHAGSDTLASESAMVVLAASPQAAASTLAAPRLPGADELATAVDDLQRRFALRLNDRELFNCLEGLEKNPMRAVIWNRLEGSMKKFFVARWKGGQQ